eukprot:6889732-Alexandrium_andersonii.AAC.1
MCIRDRACPRWSGDRCWRVAPMRFHLDPSAVGFAWAAARSDQFKSSCRGFGRSGWAPLQFSQAG